MNMSAPSLSARVDVATAHVRVAALGAELEGQRFNARAVRQEGGPTKPERGREADPFPPPEYSDATLARRSSAPGR